LFEVGGVGDGEVVGVCGLLCEYYLFAALGEGFWVFSEDHGGEYCEGLSAFGEFEL
jgi:hypothetical protein